MTEPSEYKYEPDELPKRKHHWDKDEPGFEKHRSYRVAKCPRSLSPDVAERLLAEGIPFWPRGWTETYPKRIYVVHAGAVYRATPTNPGVSYHGFPESGEELRRLPRSVREAILEGARELNCEQEVLRWMNS